MKIRNLFILFVVVAAGACDRRVSQMAEAAESCAKAESGGNLDIAEVMCQRALGDITEGVLEPEVKSERLYRLARIKRQRGKFDEADELLRQSLEIEKALSRPDGTEAARSLLERSLALAGLGKWDEGARVLEKTLPLADQLTEKEQLSMANILRHYAVQLRRTGRTDLASQFESAVAELGRE